MPGFGGECSKKAVQRWNVWWMVEAQGGDSEVILNPDKFEKAPYVYEVKAEKDGYITHIDAEGCGIASAMLGAGRETKESEIDYTAGIILHKKTGEKVNKGDVLAALYTSKEELFEAAAEKYKKSIFIEQEAPRRNLCFMPELLQKE